MNDIDVAIMRVHRATDALADRIKDNILDVSDDTKLIGVALSKLRSEQRQLFNLLEEQNGNTGSRTTVSDGVARQLATTADC